MEIFLPALESKMVALVGALRFVVFAIMVVGMIAYAASPRTGSVGLLRVIVKAVIIVAAVAFMDQWFPRVERFFMDVANYIDPGYKDNPTSSADTIRESTTDNPEGHEWSWRHINESIYQAVTRAMANIFIYVGTLITVPMLILQYVLRWILYFITPFMLALLMVPGFGGIAVRFFQQLLAILAWPIGFAITNLVALAVWTDFRGAVGPNPATMTDAMYSPLLTFMGGILATIMIIVGMIATPIVMQALFAQGQAFTGHSANFAHMVNMGSRAIYGLSYRWQGGSRAPMPIPTAAASAAPPAANPPPLAAARPGL
jgi:hypothetical protein